MLRLALLRFVSLRLLRTGTCPSAMFGCVACDPVASCKDHMLRQQLYHCNVYNCTTVLSTIGVACNAYATCALSR